MKKTKISVVAPCFNEGKNIRKNIKKINDYLAARFYDYEIIAVNDGSRDNTREELLVLQQEIGLRIVDNQENRGKGGAVRDGILASKNDNEVVMFIDSDLGIPIEELDKFIEELENGHDIVIASRFVPGLKVIRPVQAHRRVMEKAFRLIRMAITNNWNVKDTQCGFKVFRREAAMKIFPKLTVKRFAFDAEVIFVAKKHKFKIKELPIRLQNPPSRSLRIMRDPANMVWDLLKIRMNDWKGKYDNEQ
ncbi:MAG TPA: glycosyltransferase [Candidatus Bathyarchaeia archaeon]|nr:glycosyltransferase [Candidatus Bathyarchaeia archaeon]